MHFFLPQAILEELLLLLFSLFCLSKGGFAIEFNKLLKHRSHEVPVFFHLEVLFVCPWGGSEASLTKPHQHSQDTHCGLHQDAGECPASQIPGKGWALCPGMVISSPESLTKSTRVQFAEQLPRLQPWGPCLHSGLLLSGPLSRT